MRMIRILAAAALLLAAARPALAQTSAPPAQGGEPFVAGTTGQSLSLAREIVAYLRQAGVARPAGRVAVWIGAGNRSARLSLAETNVPQAVQGGVARLVDAYVARRGETGPLELSFYLERLPESDSAPGGPGARATPPRLRNMGHVSESLRRIAYVHPDYADDEHLAVRTGLRMLIDRRGRPVLVENHLRGDPQFDRYLTALAYELRFHPATVNGEPVQVWVEGPGGFEFQTRRR